MDPDQPPVRDDAAAASVYGCNRSRLKVELEKLWKEIGLSVPEGEALMKQFDEEELDIYRSKVDLTAKYKADLHEALAAAENSARTAMAATGESFVLNEELYSTLKEQAAALIPILESLMLKSEGKLKELTGIDDEVDEQGLILKEIDRTKSKLQYLSEKGLQGWCSRYEVDFEELGLLGFGAFGIVKKCKHRMDQRIYAIKLIPFYSGNNDEITRLPGKCLIIKPQVMYNTSNRKDARFQLDMCSSIRPLTLLCCGYKLVYFWENFDDTDGSPYEEYSARSCNLQG